ncbi:MAG: diguanylate cyclase [Acidobacteriota bacterium]
MRQCAICRRCYENSVILCQEHGANLGAATPEPILLADKYRLEMLIGHSSIGTVYLAEHIDLARKVAIKLLDGHCFSNRVALERFRRETRALARLKHPNIVTIHDFEIGLQGKAYLVMEYIDGHSLRAELNKGVALDPIHAVKITLGICAALEAAHTEGIIHSDLKPENIMLEKDRDGNEIVKVLDFGFAQLKQSLYNSTDSKTTEADTITIIGTPHYVSPEQCRAETLDHCTDIYLLGIVCYEMLTGRVPFTAEHVPLIILQHATQPPIPPTQLRPELDANLSTVILRALEKDRQHRQQSVIELVEELRACMAGVDLIVAGHTIASEFIHRSLTSTQIRFDSPRVATGSRIRGLAYDILTGVYTKAYFLQRLKEVLNQSTRATILTIDLDRFHYLNSRYGYLVADAVLRAFAQWLYDKVNSYGLIARVGGDEFQILLPEENINVGITLAEQLLEQLKSHTFFADQVADGVILRASIGIAAFPENGVETAELLNSVNNALGLAKHQGGGCYACLDHQRVSGALRPRLNYDAFVGRDSELARLRACLEAAVANQNRPVLIIGEQGIGKTRLLSEFGCELLGKDVLLLSSCFYEIGQGVPYRVFYETLYTAIKDLSESAGSDLTAVFGPLAERVHTEFIKNDLLGPNQSLLGIQSEQNKYHFFEYLSRLYLNLAQLCPMVLALDDLQWADELSLEFITYLLRTIAGHRILFVTTLREDKLTSEENGLKGWLRRITPAHNFEQIRLQGLPEAELRQLLKLIFTRVNIPYTTLHRLHQESKGNPHYIIEIVRLLVADGVINWQGEQWQCSELSEIKMPATVMDQVEMQLSKLDTPLLEMLMQCAVFGQRCDFDMLLTINSGDEDELLSLVESAINQQLLIEEESCSDIYRFRSDAVRKVLYNRLQKRRRRKLHKEIGALLEVKYSGQHNLSADLIAYHYYYAENYLKALDYSLTAARSAWQAFDLVEAENYFVWAAECLEKLGWTKLGKFDRTVESVRITWLVDFCLGYGRLLSYKGEEEQAEAQFKHALVIAEQTATPNVLGLALSELSDLYLYQGRYREALAGCQQAIAHLEAVNQVNALVQTFNIAGQACTQLGDFAQAVGYYEHGLQLARSLDDYAGECDLLCNLVLVCLNKGDYDCAIDYSWQATDITHTISNQLREYRWLNVLTTLYTTLGCFEQALEHCQQALALTRGFHYQQGESISLQLFGEVLYQQGQIGQAREYFQQSLEITRALSERGSKNQSLYQLGRLSAWEGEQEKALTAFLQELDLQHKCGAQVKEIKVLISIAELLARGGENLKALERFSQALRISQEIGYPDGEWRALFGMARCQGVRNRKKIALALLRKAISLIEMLAAKLSKREERESFLHDKRAIYTLYEELQSKREHTSAEVLQDKLLLDELVGIDFSIAQGHMRIARNILENLNKQFPNHPDILARLTQVGEVIDRD